MKIINCIFSLLLISLVAYSQPRKAEIIPKKFVAKVTLHGQKDYQYYALSQKSKTEYTVTGPGKLTLNYRVRIGSEQFKSEPFRIKYIRSGKKVVTIEVPELLSGGLKFKSKTLDGTPTRLQKVEITVPPGKHTYQFYKSNTEQKIYMRTFYTAYPKPVWKDIYPSSPIEKRDIRFIKSGTVKSYYQITKQKGFDFSIHDSTHLRIIVRPEFSYKMLEETILKIKLSNLTTGENKVYKVNSKKSNQMEFVSYEKMTPGMSSTFYINLTQPKKSSNVYSIKLVSGAKAALIRISKDKNLLK